MSCKDLALRVYDVETQVAIRDFGGLHDERCGVLDWDPVQRSLTSGSRSGVIVDFDMRAPKCRFYDGHAAEVCGLKWRPDGAVLAPVAARA